MERGLVFGLNIGELLGIYDPDSQSWKTWEHSLFGGLMPFSDRFPKSGIMQSGRIYGQATWAHRTGENESGSWPTPMTPAGNADGRLQEWACSKQTRERLIAEHGKELINGQLNPQWVDWLMGYPVGWTDLKDSEMQLSLR